MNRPSFISLVSVLCAMAFAPSSFAAAGSGCGDVTQAGRQSGAEARAAAQACVAAKKAPVSSTMIASFGQAADGSGMRVTGYGFTAVNHVRYWSTAYGTSQPMIDFYPDYPREWIATGVYPANWTFSIGKWVLTDTEMFMPTYDTYEGFLMASVDKVEMFSYDPITGVETKLACRDLSGSTSC